MTTTAGGSGTALDATVKTEYTIAELEALLELRKQQELEQRPARIVERMRDKLARAEREVEYARGYLADAEAALAASKGGD